MIIIMMMIMIVATVASYIIVYCDCSDRRVFTYFYKNNVFNQSI